ncbi:hypothetical protein [Stenotrophomonas maltophilia]|uniref:hypothetical protein n=1 Tax=Stenotrophomonas maltophilia TaxID=40324 RepID=UPI0007F8B147|nr:hypothetical protein [Stenotrophomonas maltophilia]OBU56378.1 hypothetical protein A9K70_16200 [Stenotrophomonas maltophilia]
MKKQLIALRGASNSGKSSTLLMLYRLLAAHSATRLISFEAIGHKLDFSAIVQINGCKIGIFNRGDVSGTVDGLIDQLAQAGCKVIVCAARSKGDVGDVLASYERRYQLQEIVIKTGGEDESDFALVNMGVAHDLAARVYSAVVV